MKVITPHKIRRIKRTRINYNYNYFTIILQLFYNYNYNVDNIDEAFTNATLLTQHQLLYNQKQTNKNTQPIFNIPYNSNTTHIGQILKRHWYLIEKDPKLKILWPDMPMVAYKRNKNIKDIVVHSQLTNNNLSN